MRGRLNWRISQLGQGKSRGGRARVGGVDGEGPEGRVAQLINELLTELGNEGGEPARGGIKAQGG